MTNFCNLFVCFYIHLNIIYIDDYLLVMYILPACDVRNFTHFFQISLKIRLFRTRIVSGIILALLLNAQNSDRAT